MNIVFKSSHRSKELDDPLTIEAIFCPTVRGRSPEEGGTVWRRAVETVDPYLPKQKRGCYSNSHNILRWVPWSMVRSEENLSWGKEDEMAELSH